METSGQCDACFEESSRYLRNRCSTCCLRLRVAANGRATTWVSCSGCTGCTAWPAAALVLLVLGVAQRGTSIASSGLVAGPQRGCQPLRCLGGIPTTVWSTGLGCPGVALVPPLTAAGMLRRVWMCLIPPSRRGAQLRVEWACQFGRHDRPSDSDSDSAMPAARPALLPRSRGVLRQAAASRRPIHGTNIYFPRTVRLS